MKPPISSSGGTDNLVADLFRQALREKTRVRMTRVTKFIAETDSSGSWSLPFDTHKSTNRQRHTAAPGITRRIPYNKWLEAYYSKVAPPANAGRASYHSPRIEEIDDSTPAHSSKADTRAVTERTDPDMPSLMRCDSGDTLVDQDSHWTPKAGGTQDKLFNVPPVTDPRGDTGSWVRASSVPATSCWTFPFRPFASVPPATSNSKLDNWQSTYPAQQEPNLPAPKHVTFNEESKPYTFSNFSWTSLDETQFSTSRNADARSSQPPGPENIPKAFVTSVSDPPPTETTFRDQVPECLKVPIGPPVSRQEDTQDSSYETSMSDMVLYGQSARAALRNREGKNPFLPSWSDKDDAALSKSLYDLYHPDPPKTSLPADARAHSFWSDPSLGLTGWRSQASSAPHGNRNITIHERETEYKLGNHRRLVTRETKIRV